MAEELSALESSATTEDGVEEITGLIDQLAVDEDALTGTHLRSDLMESAQTGSYAPTRTSAPPPVPPEARQSRPPTVRSSAVPPPPKVPSHSGMFRIDRASSAPSLPPPGAQSAEQPVTQPGVSLTEIELRDMRAHVHRLRLMVRLREDRIRELETALREQTERNTALTRDLQGVKTQRGPDDLKRIAGIGPSFERGLQAAGVTSFKQIAAWTPEDIENFALKLRIVSKRIVRDRWIESARQLLADEEALESESSELLE